jgi:transposase InsO family protein
MRRLLLVCRHRANRSACKVDRLEGLSPQTRRTFLENHAKSMVSVDFFAVPTLRFQVLCVFLVLAHDRRRIVQFGVTAHPTVEWTVQHLRNAFPWDSAPRYLLRDRDRILGSDFVEPVKARGIQQVLSAPRCPWQRAFVERVIGPIRPRMSEPCDCVQRELSASHPIGLLCLLP